MSGGVRGAAGSMPGIIAVQVAAQAFRAQHLHYPAKGEAPSLVVLDEVVPGTPGVHENNPEAGGSKPQRKALGQHALFDSQDPLPPPVALVAVGLP